MMGRICRRVPLRLMLTNPRRYRMAVAIRGRMMYDGQVQPTVRASGPESCANAGTAVIRAEIATSLQADLISLAGAQDPARHGARNDHDRERNAEYDSKQ